MKNLYHQDKGTNQHKKRTRIMGMKISTWKSLIVLILVINIAGIMGNEAQSAKDGVLQIPVPVDGIITAHASEPSTVPHTPQYKEIHDYIAEVFGKDQDKAFLLLSCENSSLNPDAVNTTGNTPAGSRDTGVFQISEYWQKVQFKFLLNYRTNVEIAHDLYVENGNSFKLWSCARKVGLD